MQDRITFPDFSAFQIDIPHGSWPHDSFWPGAAHPDPDLYSAFRLDFHRRDRAEADASPSGGTARAEPKDD